MTQNGARPRNGTTKLGEELKIVIVGDGGCGKTSLLMVYAKGDFPEVRGALKSHYVCHLCLMIYRHSSFTITPIILSFDRISALFLF